MANLRELGVSLFDWETRAVLDALNKERTRLKVLVETTDDKDEAADAGNDLLELGGLLERLESQEKSVFGDQITNFNSQSI